LEEQHLKSEGAEAKAKPVRQGPRSKLVEAIAVLLLARPMRVAEIAQVLGKPPRYISSYLSYWRVRGLFDYENGYWVLTPEGEEYARTILEREMNTRVAQYATLARQILEAEQVKATIKGETGYYRGGESGAIQRFIASHTSLSANKQQERSSIPVAACVRAVLAQLEGDLDDEERQIVEYMLQHYAKWGSTYTYADQLARDLSADTLWLLQVARRLQSKGLIYIYNDKRLGMRIGLSKRLKQLLKACQT
jgi:hypothetical protein